MRAKQCDQCGTFAVVEEPVKRRGWPEEGLPKNWLNVLCFDNEHKGHEQDKEPRYKVDAEFCSFSCASKYLDNEGRARA